VVKARGSLLLTFGFVAVALLVAAPVHAQSANVLDQIVQQFKDRSANWEGTLRSFAVGTFRLLAIIELSWAAIRLAFRNADFSEWLAEIVNQVLFLGFFFALLENSVTWGQAIVDSFRQAATSAGGGGIAPSDVFTAGVHIASQVLQQMTIWHPAASAGLMVAAIVIEVCFALMAAFMVLALVESYLIISMGVLFMGLGGSRWTKDFAISTVRYTVSVGAKLFVLQLLVSIGTGLITDWANQFKDVTDESLCILIGCSIVMLALVKVLPETMQRIVNGSSMASGSALIGAAAVVGGSVAAVGAGMVGAGAMASNAFRLASAEVGASDAKAAENGGETPQRSSIARAAALTGGTAKNLAMAPIRDVGRRLTGDIGSQHGLAPWRMSADLANRRRLLADDANKPRPASNNGDGNSIS
jgi:type IV secretion system protein TrbL